MTRQERIELFALDRYISGKQNGAKNSGQTATMDKAQRLAAFQRQRQAFSEGGE